MPPVFGPAPRHMGSGMAVWTGHNWQLIEAHGAQALMGVTFGLGLLDEAVSDTGALSIALSALRTELSRPVDVGDGTQFVPEVDVSLGTDTATLTIRGSREGVSATWRRLPGLFVPGTVHADVPLLRPEPLAWPADVVHRTGHNAAALGWLKTTAPEAHALAAALLVRLNPASGTVPTVFFTTHEPLVSLAFPPRHDAGPGHRTRWADGTPACTEPERAAEPRDSPVKGSPASFDDALGISPTASNLVLLSAAVPRSTAGILAGELICRRLSAIAANTLGHQGGLQAQWSGAGAASILVVVSESRIAGESRQKLLDAAAAGLDLVPDAWLEDAVQASTPPSPRLERERRLAGLPAESPATVSEVRRAVNDAVHGSLRLNHLPALARLENTKQAEAMLLEEGTPRAFKSRVGRITHEARVGSWEPVAPPSYISSLVVGGHSIRIHGHQPGHGHRPLIADGVSTTAAVAVLEDQAGTLVIVDADLRALTLAPELFHHPKRLRQAIDARLAGVPRLAFTSTANPDGLKRRIQRQKRRRLWAIAGVAAVAGGIVALSIANSNPAVTERVRMDQTATLRNGTEIRVWGLDAAPGAAAGELDRATVQVEFCAGGDTRATGLPPQTQRSVSASDFEVFEAGVVRSQPVASDGQLQGATLQEGECTSGELTFTAAQLDSPRVVYSNAVGDDVVWYPYGETPMGK